MRDCRLGRFSISSCRPPSLLRRHLFSGRVAVPSVRNTFTCWISLGDGTVATRLLCQVVEISKMSDFSKQTRFRHSGHDIVTTRCPVPSKNLGTQRKTCKCESMLHQLRTVWSVPAVPRFGPHVTSQHRELSTHQSSELNPRIFFHFFTPILTRQATQKTLSILLSSMTTAFGSWLSRICRKPKQHSMTFARISVLVT